MNDAERIPQGDLILRTIAMPADTNPNGDIFGGWMMSQMDIAGGILAKEISASRVVTVAVDKLEFHRPVKVGQVVCCYGRCERIGNTSMTISLEVWVQTILDDQHEPDCCVTEGVFTFVAIDQQGKPRSVRN